MNAHDIQKQVIPGRTGFLRVLGMILLRCLIFLVLISPAIFIQHQKLAAVRKKPRLYRDSLYLPSGEKIKLISLGYDRFMADFLWLRSIQAFGGHWGTDKNYEPIYHLFDVITDLDPHFLDAYTFGNLVMGDEGGDQFLGLELIDKGIYKNPRKYVLPYWGGYVAYWQLDNPEMAKYYYSRALKCPDAPGYVSRIVAYMDLKAGRYHVAFEKYVRDLLNAIDEKDDVVEGIAKNRIPDILIEWHQFILEEALNKYIEQKGREPENIHDLEKAGVIQSYPLVIFPVLIRLVDYYKSRPGEVMDHFREIIDNSTKQNTTTIPLHPRGYWYQLHPRPMPGEGMAIIDGEQLMGNMVNYLNKVRRRIYEFYKENGRFPAYINEIYGEPIEAEEPLGGEWIYLPYGIFYSSTMPFL